MTVETCVHYLNFASEEIPDGDTRYKCAPPIRSSSNRQGLWAALEAGALDILSTDHSPAPPEMKKFEEGNFLTAWGGISGVCPLFPFPPRFPSPSHLLADDDGERSRMRLETSGLVGC